MQCKYSNKCGSCMYMDKKYDEQLKIKQKTVIDLLMPVIFGMISPPFST